MIQKAAMIARYVSFVEKQGMFMILWFVQNDEKEPESDDLYCPPTSSSKDSNDKVSLIIDHKDVHVYTWNCLVVCLQP